MLLTGDKLTAGIAFRSLLNAKGARQQPIVSSLYDPANCIAVRITATHWYTAILGPKNLASRLRGPCRWGWASIAPTPLTWPEAGGGSE